MEKIFIWGTGFISRQVLEQCDVMGQYDLIGFIDNDQEKQGEFFFGKRIYAPSVLLEKSFDLVVVLVDKYEEISSQIRDILKTDGELPVENYRYFYKKNILKRYQDCHDEEITKVLQHIGKSGLQIFNYSFADQYKKIETCAEYDTDCGLFYVQHQGKRLYFAKTFSKKEEVESYYRDILMEQDKESPHKYLDEEFDVKEGDVVVDIGAAEGNFSLQVIDRVSKLYIIETEDVWIDALNITFKDYLDKVVIIKKFITSLNDGKYATLDSLIQEPVNFIKMDIEGNEWDALLGAENLIRRSKELKCAACSYHTDFDEILIKDVLGRYGMQCSVTPGYMWFPYAVRTKVVSTKLCRGIVRGVK